jgi:hypothetical protein
MRKTPLRRKSKTSAAKLKIKLWELCKQLTRKKYGYNCYTCGQTTQAPHTGHFISSSVCSGELRYSLDNLRPQCYRCNIHLSGNWLSFEQNLIRDKGKEWVEALKRRNQETKGRKYDEIWLQAKIEEYEKMLS